MLSLGLLLAAGVVYSQPTVFQPQQVHLSFTGENDSMGVDFVTDANVACNDTGVAFGTSPAALDTFVPSVSCFKLTGVGFLSQVKIPQLKAGTLYYYVAGSQTAKNWAWSEVFSFVMPDVSPTAAKPLTAAVYADMGWLNAESLPKLTSDSQQGLFDFVIHAGDFAYDMDALNGQVGSNFMLAIEPFSSSRPYMTSAGNHEVVMNFTQYKSRFAAITNFTAPSSNSNSNHFYSFDAGLVHWVAIDTEVYDEFQGSDLPTNMLNWLAKDLTKANANRAAVPWVAAYGHKASYMASNSSLWEKLFRDLGVDVYFCGHVHSYTRWLPFDPITKVYDQETIVAAGPNVYTDPKYVVPIVSGSPGCQEVSAERHCLPMDAKGAQNARCGNYGYGYFTAVNHSHAHWRWETAVPLNGTSDASYVDDLWIVQSSHGPRA